MAARTKSYVTPKFKTKYKVRSWPVYEAALRRRGDVTVWFDEAAADAWNATHQRHELMETARRRAGSSPKGCCR